MKIDPNNFQELEGLSPGEAEEIVLSPSIIDYVPPNEKVRVLTDITSKLAKGGRLVIESVDVRQWCYAFANYQVGLEELHMALYGDQTNMGTRIGAMDVMTLAGVLENLGFRIIKKQSDVASKTYVLEGIKQ